MKGKQTLSVLLTVGLLFALLSGLGLAKEPTPEAQPYKGFTYQGRLLDNGSPANGEYEAQFRLFDVSMGGTALASLNDDLTITDGLFTAHIMFGSQWFTGDARWLEVALRPSGSPDPYTTLSPRQELTPAPYALALPGLWTQTNTTSPNVIGGYKDNNVTVGAYGAAIGGGGKATEANAVTDNFGTVAGGDLNQAGNGTGAVDDASCATVGGGSSNIASGELSTIAGGLGGVASEQYATVGGGTNNVASGQGSVVAGGEHNTASGHQTTVSGGEEVEATGDWATVGGGQYSVAGADFATVSGGGPTEAYNPSTANRVTDDYGVVGGGGGNQAGDADADPTDARGATVGGGLDNAASGLHATVSGGSDNTAGSQDASVGGGYSNDATGMGATIAGGFGSTAGGTNSTVGGGYLNSASNSYATISGGSSNVANALYATVGGGYDNDARGDYATVPGGHENWAEGDYSLAAGQKSGAIHDGSFVWNDSTDEYLTSELDDQWLSRASGGYYLYTSLATGVYVAGGGGAWSSLSDRNLKENLEAVDARAVLEAVAAMPVSTWSYTTEDPTIRHMGPMAQDFHAAFGLGDSDRHINSLDADGVALAAIQGLYAENQELRARLDTLESRLAALEGAGLLPLKGAGPMAGLLLGGLAVAGVVVVQRRAGGGR